MTKCFLKNCHNERCFTFPKDPALREQWLIKIRVMPGTVIRSHDGLCKIHFTGDDFTHLPIEEKFIKRFRLKPGVIPSLYLPAEDEITKLKPKSCSLGLLEERQSAENTIHEYELPVHYYEQVNQVQTAQENLTRSILLPVNYPEPVKQVPIAQENATQSILLPIHNSEEKNQVPIVHENSIQFILLPVSHSEEMNQVTTAQKNSTRSILWDSNDAKRMLTCQVEVCPAENLMNLTRKYKDILVNKTDNRWKMAVWNQKLKHQRRLLALHTPRKRKFQEMKDNQVTCFICLQNITKFVVHPFHKGSVLCMDCMNQLLPRLLRNVVLKPSLYCCLCGSHKTVFCCRICSV